MPASAWTQQDYIDFYSPCVLRYDPDHPLYGQDLGYSLNRARYSTRTEWETYRRLIDRLVNGSTFSVSDIVLWVGCGGGWSLAMARDVGVGLPANQVWGLETSTYIQDNLNSLLDPRFPELLTHILNLDLTDATTTLLKAAGVPNPGRVDWIIGENVDESIPANELAAWLAAYHSGILTANGNAVHFVDVQDEAQTEPAPDLWVAKGLTWQPLTAWAALAPSDYWIATNRYEFVAGDPPTSQMVMIPPGA